MLADLSTHRLEVTLAPSKQNEIAERGGMIRVVMDANTPWYQRMCADYPSTRKRDKRAPDTAIRRQDVLHALETMLKTGWVTTLNQNRILAYIPGALRDMQAQAAEGRKAALQRKLEKQKAKRRGEEPFTRPPVEEPDDFMPF
jgi:hypothetical protein